MTREQRRARQQCMAPKRRRRTVKTQKPIPGSASSKRAAINQPRRSYVMKDLAEDRDEVEEPTERRWIGRARRRYGIRSDEPTTWTVEVEQTWLDPEHYESAVVDILRSPGDALASAEARAANAARRDGIGSWTLEVFGDGVNGPRRLVVRPHADDA